MQLRRRDIDPDFFSDSGISTLTAEARLGFIGLWLLADKEGRLELKPLDIMGKLFPLNISDPQKGIIQIPNSKPCSIYSIFNELIDSEMLIAYKNSTRCFLQIVNFTKYQRPHPHEKKSIHPELNKEVEVLPSITPDVIKCNYKNYKPTLPEDKVKGKDKGKDKDKGKGKDKGKDKGKGKEEGQGKGKAPRSEAKGRGAQPPRAENSATPPDQPDPDKSIPSMKSMKSTPVDEGPGSPPPDTAIKPLGKIILPNLGPCTIPSEISDVVYNPVAYCVNPDHIENNRLKNFEDLFAEYLGQLLVAYNTAVDECSDMLEEFAAEHRYAAYVNDWGKRLYAFHKFFHEKEIRPANMDIHPDAKIRICMANESFTDFLNVCNIIDNEKWAYDEHPTPTAKAQEA